MQDLYDAGQQEKEANLSVPREDNLRLRSIFLRRWPDPAASQEQHSVPHGKLL